MDLLPEGTPLVTLGVTEPFTTSLKVSFYVALAIVLPLVLWQIWAFLAPAVARGHAARDRRVRRVRDVPLRRGRGLLLRDRAPEGADVPRRLRLGALRRADPGELLPLVRHADAARVRDRVPDADLHPRASCASASSPRTGCAATGASATSRCSRSRSSCRRSTPSRSCSRWCRSSCSSSSRSGSPSSWSAAGSAGGRGRGRGSVRIVSADWVVPVEGDPSRTAPSRSTTTAGSPRSGRPSELGAGERFDGCVIVPGFVNCHSHLEYAVYAGFGDGLPFSSWIGLHVARKGRLDLDDMRAIATDGAHECLRSGITTVGDCSFAGAAAEAAAETGPARDRLPRGVRPRRVGARPLRGAARARRAPRLRPPRPRRLAARAVHVHPGALRGLRRRSGSRMATHLAESVAEREFLVDGIGRLVGVRAACSSRRRASRASGCSPTRACSARASWPRTASTSTTRRSRCSPPHGVGVAHCPRSNGFLGCGVAPLAELLERGDRRRHRDRQPRLDAVVRPLRGAPDGDRRRARARAAARRAHRGATRSSSRRSAARGCSASSTRSARSCPGKQADLAVVSLDGSRSTPLKILLRRSSWEGRRTGLQLLS